jgi:uncharacterized protein with FMN-binding domain
MKKFRKTGMGAVLPALLLGIMVLGFVACSNPTGGGGSSRTRVEDGTYVTTGIGKSVTTPITVATSFANNTLVGISIGENEETSTILDSVESLLIPRVIKAQSIGVDGITGATLSSGGVKEAVAKAIDEAGGDSSEWYTAPPKSSRLVKLAGYDVIVVGLGGAGVSAYIKAAEDGTKVYGIEAAGKIGGNSTTAGGPMAINSEWIKTRYTGGADYINRDAILKQWYADMEANDVPAGEVPSVSSVTVDGTSYPVPNIETTVPRYQGGPKWEIIKLLVDQSGPTVTWLAENHGFRFSPPSGLGFPQYSPVTNYASDDWGDHTPPYGGGPYTGYADDDAYDLFKTYMFTRPVEIAKRKNAYNDYKLELRATRIITDTTTGQIRGVEARYYDGTTYEIYGKTVILATGGFIGNPEMMQEYFGSSLKAEAVHTERGDGIKMAQALDAGTYNIEMPAMVHIAQLENIIQRQIHPTDPVKDLEWKAALSNLLLKGDNLLVALKEGQTGDLRGQRFCNEALGMAAGGIAFDNWKAGGHFAAIYSDDMFEDLRQNGTPFTSMVFSVGQGMYIPNTPITDIDAILAMGVDGGDVIRAGTLEELAAKLDVPAATLQATITQYNSYVDGETDPLYDKSAVPPMGPPGTPAVNYYTTKITENAETAGGYTAILGAGYYYGTCGGLDVDSDMQVLHKDTKAKIPGLYAAGQDSMGVLFNHKKSYVSYGAAAQGWAITSGRLAGASAAAEAGE